MTNLNLSQNPSQSRSTWNNISRLQQTCDSMDEESQDYQQQSEQALRCVQA